MDEARGLWGLAEEYLAAAEDANAAGRKSVAFAEARHAAELAAKSRLQWATGEHPGRRHNVAGALARHGLIPATVDGRALSRLLDQHTRGEYGFDAVPSQEDIDGALAIARALLAAPPF